MKPVQTALLIVGLLTLYLIGGTLLREPPILVSETDTTKENFLVQVSISQASDYQEKLTVRGTVRAFRTVQLRAEIEGRVLETPLEKGQRVEEGQLICRLDPADRPARLAEATAILEQRKLELAAAEELQAKGYRPEVQLSAARAQMRAAESQTAVWQRAVDNLDIVAPFDGFLNDRQAEVGDFLRKADICGVVTLEDPMRVVAEVAEQEINRLKLGATARFYLEDDTSADGKLVYISNIANQTTRAFPVELEVRNKDQRLRDGLTATLELNLGVQRAHKLPPSALVLSDAGQLGIRSVSPENKVIFHSIRLLDDDPLAIWVTGLPERTRVITTGQNFVSEGDTVRSVVKGAKEEAS